MSEETYQHGDVVEGVVAVRLFKAGWGLMLKTMAGDFIGWMVYRLIDSETIGGIDPQGRPERASLREAQFVEWYVWTEPCTEYVVGYDPLLCAKCGGGIEGHRHLVNMQNTEKDCDAVVAFCAQLGMTRQEVTTVLMTVAINHAITTGVDLERIWLAVRGLHAWRQRQGQNEKTLVPDVQPSARKPFRTAQEERGDVEAQLDMYLSRAANASRASALDEMLSDVRGGLHEGAAARARARRGT